MNHKEDSHEMLTFHTPVGIGDVNSNEKGSGARFNEGKPPFELIPLRLIADCFMDRPIVDVLYSLAVWQEGGKAEDLWLAVDDLARVLKVTREQMFIDCARVFEYGRKKYAAWNWLKGMPWSVVLGCAVRHLFAIDRGEELDKESGFPHSGHFMCNIIMLTQFERTYKEGDDRPPKEFIK